MADILIKGLIQEGRARVLFTNTTNIVQTCKERHGSWPSATAALGRTISIGVLMGSMLKSTNERLTIQINGGGPLGTILVRVSNGLKVKGFVVNLAVSDINPITGKLAVGSAVGKDGYLRVTKDLNLKSDFTGEVKLVSGEIAEDFAHYFNTSEQTPSYVSAGVLVDDVQVLAAGAVIIQMLPDANEQDIMFIEDLVSGLKPISSLVFEYDDYWQLLQDIFGDIELIDRVNPYWACDCSEEGMLAAISTLASDDILAMIEEDNGCEICCQFCSTKYQFNRMQLAELLKVKVSIN